LLSFVAHHGSLAAGGEPVSGLEALVIRALKASRRDSALARMLPVFLWRMRGRLAKPRLLEAAQQQSVVAPLGFFIELASMLGGGDDFKRLLADLRASAKASRSSYFFAGTSGRPFERAAADLNSPAEARRWGLLMNMPLDSFASYFRKVAAL
jgi:hypothetical protein